MKPIIDSDEWNDVETEPTVVENLLECVKKNSTVLVKFIPQLSRVAVEIVVSKYAIDGLSDKIGSDIGFFKKMDSSVIAISSASIKSFKPVVV